MKENLQTPRNGKSFGKILLFHRYPSHPISKRKSLGKQTSSTLALTELFSILIFHCNCFLLIWMLKCLRSITGHDPAVQSINGSDGKGEGLTSQFGCNALCWPLLIIKIAFFFCLQIKMPFIWHPKGLIILFPPLLYMVDFLHLYMSSLQLQSINISTFKWTFFVSTLC